MQFIENVLLALVMIGFFTMVAGGIGDSISNNHKDRFKSVSFYGFAIVVTAGCGLVLVPTAKMIISLIS